MSTVTGIAEHWHNHKVDQGVTINATFPQGQKSAAIEHSGISLTSSEHRGCRNDLGSP